MNITYRFMEQGEEGKVCSLIEQVFNEFVAPDFDKEGVDEFFKFAEPSALAARRGDDEVIMVAEHENKIVGVVEMLRYDHVSMLFVGLRRQGIARTLVNMAIEECLKRKPDVKEITVNSSPFAEVAYTKMGFAVTGEYQKKNGIIFVPMVRKI